MHWLKKYKLVLLSSSPRRKSLLESCGFEIKTKSYDFDESYPASLDKRKVPEFLSDQKMNFALNADVFFDDEILITADTIVLDGNEILEKPSDIDNAKLLLKKISGKSHFVLTGVTMANNQHKISFTSVSKVYFSTIDQNEIDYYVENYRVLDKAGAYGIQDWIGMCKVYKIEGSYTNVMGLPTDMVYNKLKYFELK